MRPLPLMSVTDPRTKPGLIHALTWQQWRFCFGSVILLNYGFFESSID
jgi:hypothetical protein